MVRRSGRVVDRDLGFNEIVENLSKFRKSQILVGFQEGSITHTQTQGGRVQKAGLSMPQIAAQNEFGAGNIPARPFMRTSFDENRANIQRVIISQYNRVVDGKTTAEKALGAIGQYVVSLIQRKIRQITTPPNSPVTIAIKKSSKPLIDFGQMIRSVTYVVKR